MAVGQQTEIVVHQSWPITSMSTITHKFKQRTQVPCAACTGRTSDATLKHTSAQTRSGR